MLAARLRAPAQPNPTRTTSRPKHKPAIQNTGQRYGAAENGMQYGSARQWGRLQGRERQKTISLGQTTRSGGQPGPRRSTRVTNRNVRTRQLRLPAMGSWVPATILAPRPRYHWGPDGSGCDRTCPSCASGAGQLGADASRHTSGSWISGASTVPFWQSGQSEHVANLPIHIGLYVFPFDLQTHARAAGRR